MITLFKEFGNIKLKNVILHNNDAYFYDSNIQKDREKIYELGRMGVALSQPRLE